MDFFLYTLYTKIIFYMQSRIVKYKAFVLPLLYVRKRKGIQLPYFIIFYPSSYIIFQILIIEW